jgi:hypothetical protein
VEKQKELIDDLDPATFWVELISLYKPVKAMRFVGWCVVLGVAMEHMGEKVNRAEAAECLVRVGIKRAAAYAAVADIVAFKAHLEKVLKRRVEYRELHQKMQQAAAQGLPSINMEIVL